MMTVVDHVMPWFMPSRTLATMIQAHDGAHISSRGTGMPMSQPATRIGLRPMRSVSAPVARLVSALVAPKATTKVVVAVNAVSPKVRSASSGRTVRSWPIIPPTSALTATSRQNWARFSRKPEPAPPGRRGERSCAGVERAVASAQSLGPTDEHGDVARVPCAASSWRRSLLARRVRTSPPPVRRAARLRAASRARRGSAPGTCPARTRCAGGRRATVRRNPSAARSGVLSTGRPAARQASMPPSSSPRMCS